MELLKTDIVMLHSFPCGGKSTLSQKYLENGYVILSRDIEGGVTLDLLPKYLQLIRNKQKICLDNTNMTVDIRAEFINLAKLSNVTIGCHILEGVPKKIYNPISEKMITISAKDIMKEQSLINSLNRMYEKNEAIYMSADDTPKEILTDGQSFVLPAIFVHNKRVQIPKKNEGFDELIKTQFVRTNMYPHYKNKAVFVDLDSTVRATFSGDKYPIKRDDIYILDNSKEVLEQYKKNDYMIIGVTNQSGITKKHLTMNLAIDIAMDTNNMLGGVFADIYICPHFPTITTCYCRKPGSGFGIKAMHEYQLDLNECIMIGDRSTDFNFARRLGIKFKTEKEFFNR